MSLIPLYRGMPDFSEALDVYRAAGFEVAGSSDHPERRDGAERSRLHPGQPAGGVARMMATGSERACAYVRTDGFPRARSPLPAWPRSHRRWRIGCSIAGPTTGAHGATGGRHRAGAPASIHPRLVAGRAPADGLSEWKMGNRLQQRLYNHVQLRREMESAGRAPASAGIPDTETLLYLHQGLGVEACSQAQFRRISRWRCGTRGRRELWLARDRSAKSRCTTVGKARLSCSAQAQGVACSPGVRGGCRSQRARVASAQQHIPAPHSIHSGIRKAPPGTWLRLAPGGRDAEPVQYWSLAEVAEHGVANPFTGDETKPSMNRTPARDHGPRADNCPTRRSGRWLSGGIVRARSWR